MAWSRRTRPASLSAHATRPLFGASRPCISLISTLLPAPFAPRTMVVGAACNSSDSGWMIGLPFTAYDTLSSRRGRIMRPRSAVAPLRGVLDELRRGVEREDDRDQHQAEAKGETEVALGGLERNGGRHHARDAVDIAADDNDRADFRARPAEAGEHHREERKAHVPQHRERAAQAADAERLQLLPVFLPCV